MRHIADLHAGEAKTDARDEPSLKRPSARCRTRCARFDLLTSRSPSSPCCAVSTTISPRRSRRPATAFATCLPRSIPHWNGFWGRVSTIRPCSICLSGTRRPPSSLRPAKKTLAKLLTKLAPRMGKSLAAEIVQALSEQAVVVPGTQAATIVMPRLAQQLASLRNNATRLPAKLIARCMHTHVGRS
jgi:hypothetical protein